jgi:hypothetical protein
MKSRRIYLLTNLSFKILVCISVSDVRSHHINVWQSLAIYLPISEESPWITIQVFQIEVLLARMSDCFEEMDRQNKKCTISCEEETAVTCVLNFWWTLIGILTLYILSSKDSELWMWMWEWLEEKNENKHAKHSELMKI